MAPRKKAGRSGAALQVWIDPAVREAVDAYLAAYNASHDHRATLTSTIEAALKKYLAGEGHWPPSKKSR